MKYTEWDQLTLNEIQRELLGDNPVRRWMHGVRFVSMSAGRSRRRRPRTVTLLQYDGDRRAGRWRFWRGEDRQDGGRIPWDQWATEIGFDSSQIVREEFEKVLNQCRNRF